MRRLGQRPLGREAEAEEADAERLADAQHLAQMKARLRRRVVQRLDGAAGKLELAARLEADVAAQLAVLPLQGDDLLALDDRLPAEAGDQRLHQRRDAAFALVWDRRQGVGVEHELLVLGADPPLGLGLLARGDPRDEVIPRSYEVAWRPIFTCRHSAGLGVQVR